MVTQMEEREWAQRLCFGCIFECGFWLREHSAKYKIARHRIVLHNNCYKSKSIIARASLHHHKSIIARASLPNIYCSSQNQHLSTVHG